MKEPWWRSAPGSREYRAHQLGFWLLVNTWLAGALQAYKFAGLPGIVGALPLFIWGAARLYDYIDRRLT